MACEKCSRREFLLVSGTTVAVGIALPALVSCATSSKSPTSPGGSVTIDVTQSANAVLAAPGGALYVNDPNDADRPIIVVRIDQTTVNAFSSRCTHLGGQVALPSGGVETCPVHGSQFDTAGKVLAGPATANLKTYVATISNNVITIKT
jgi:cytochrome b6-f complex iron-sulfur subunit